MKAIVRTKSGPAEHLQLQELPTPTPGDSEVLVKVHAATVTRGDVIMRGLPAILNLPMRLMGMNQKRIPGHEFAGVIEAVGPNVSRFEVGDAVFGTTTGLPVGANAEYVCLPEQWKQGVIARKPANISFEEAAAVPVGGMTALYILNKISIQPGQQVLVYGASGSVGTFAVQLAKHSGAVVTGVCSSANVEMVQSLGADTVIDYKREDFTQGSQRYDIIFDAVGKTSKQQSAAVLKPDGAFLSVRGLTKESTEALTTLRDIIEAGALRPVIDRRYPLAETAEAHRFVETGRKAGNVVITIVPDASA